MNLPDIVAICASSPEQAASFSAAIERRRPPDRSILLIHAGGESRRLPAWAPEGKLFAPVPVPSSTAQPPVLLDIQLGLYLRYPWRPGELVVASGDVYLDFYVSGIRSDRGEVCGFSVPASFDEGSRHGVFVFDRLQQGVTGYLQKAPVDRLRREAALPGGTQCALDIGIVAFDHRGRERLSALADRFGAAVSRGEVYIDLYVKILTASLDGISDEEFEELVAPQSRLGREDRSAIRETMRGSALQGVLGRRSTFLHYGSVAEVPETAAAIAAGGDILPFYDVPDAAGLTHDLLPQVTDGIVVSDSRQAAVGTGHMRAAAPSLVDACGKFSGELAGGNLVTAVDHVEVPSVVPPGFCLDGREGTDGLTVAVYHREDRFKSTDGPVRICGQPLTDWLQTHGVSSAGLGITDDVADIWELPLWPPLPEDRSAAERGRLIAAFWDASPAGDRWRRWLLDSPRRSVRELTEGADLTSREARRSARRAELLRHAVLDGRGWQAIPAAEATGIFSPEDRPVLARLADAEPDELIRSYRGRFLSALGPTEPSADAGSIEIPYLSSLTTPPPLRRSVKPDQIVWAGSPVRMDFGGGWTDTPPYMLREGGRVTSFAALEDYRNPPVPFALPRAA